MIGFPKYRDSHFHLSPAPNTHRFPPRSYNRVFLQQQVQVRYSGIWVFYGLADLDDGRNKVYGFCISYDYTLCILMQAFLIPKVRIAVSHRMF